MRPMRTLLCFVRFGLPLLCLFSWVTIASLAAGEEPPIDTRNAAKPERPADENPAPADEKLTYMIENPLLRSFFTEQFYEGPSNPRARSDEFVDRMVDMQIQSFAKALDHDLAELVSTTDSARQLRQRWLEAPEETTRTEAAAAFAVMLRKVARQADGLADLLQSVFPDLRRNKKLDLKVESRDADERYQRQMEFIDGQVSKAEQLIRDYLFRPGQTIALGDLGSENMLMRLDWVETVAKQVADQIL